VALHERKEELWHCMSTRRSCGAAWACVCGWPFVCMHSWHREHMHSSPCVCMRSWHCLHTHLQPCTCMHYEALCVYVVSLELTPLNAAGVLGVTAERRFVSESEKRAATNTQGLTCAFLYDRKENKTM